MGFSTQILIAVLAVFGCCFALSMSSALCGTFLKPPRPCGNCFPVVCQLFFSIDGAFWPESLPIASAYTSTSSGNLPFQRSETCLRATPSEQLWSNLPWISTVQPHNKTTPQHPVMTPIWPLVMGATTTYVTHRNPALLARNICWPEVPARGFCREFTVLLISRTAREREREAGIEHKVELKSAARYKLDH